MRSLTQRETIRSNRQQTWSVLADFGDVAAWAPYMRISHLIGEQETGTGTRRALKHVLGFRFEERVTAWTEGEAFEFDVLKAPWPMRDVRESWRLEAVDDGIAVTTRVDYGMKLGPLGTMLDWALVRFIVQREMRSGVQGLKAHVERKNGTP